MTALLYAYVIAHRRQAWLSLASLFLVSGLLLTSCTGLGGNTSPAATSTPSQQAIAKLRWCGQPLMVFRDEGAAPSPTAGSTPTATATTTPGAGGTPTVTPTPTRIPGTVTTLTDWTQVEPLLGFSVYLPTSLPNHTCLISAIGTVNDPIFGGSFVITYLLPDHNSISISEAPLRTQKPDFQCTSTTTSTPAASSTPKAGTPTPVPTQTPNQVCSGAKNQTNIVFSAPGNMNALQQFFTALQAHVSWVPTA